MPILQTVIISIVINPRNNFNDNIKYNKIKNASTSNFYYHKYIPKNKNIYFLKINI